MNKIKKLTPELITAISVFLLSLVHPFYSILALIVLISIWAQDSTTD